MKNSLCLSALLALQIVGCGDRQGNGTDFVDSGVTTDGGARADLGALRDLGTPDDMSIADSGSALDLAIAMDMSPGIDSGATDAGVRDLGASFGERCGEDMPRITTTGTDVLVTDIGYYVNDARSPDCDAEGPDMVFEFIAPAAGTFVIDTVGAVFDTVLGVYRNECAGTSIVCNDDVSSSLLWSSVTFEAAEGEVFYVVVDAYFEGTEGGFGVNITHTVTPVPDAGTPDAGLTDSGLADGG
ncbi:MAG: hypothetical protein IPK60_10845 [Sandaracinaceae bacterium]|jgi:hypothetical protein|nr:hypothetical protein [Sandaracinaceae bacterium]